MRDRTSQRAGVRPFIPAMLQFGYECPAQGQRSTGSCDFQACIQVCAIASLLCKNVQKAIQNTATRLLTIIGIGGPSLSNTASVPEGRLSHIHFTYRKIISVPVIHPAVALEAGDSQGGPQPNGTVMRHHEAHNFHKDGPPEGPSLYRVTSP